MTLRLYVLLALSSLMLYSPRSTAAEGRPHLFILAGEAGMEKLDEKTFFTPTVQSALGKDKVVVVKSAKADQPIHKWYRDMRRNPAAKQPKDAGILFGTMLQLDIDRAIAANKLQSADDFETVTFIWMQDPSGATSDVSGSYSEKVKGLVRQMKLYRRRPDMNVVIVRINDYRRDNKSLQLVRSEQVRSAKDLHRAAWVDTDDLNGPDNDLHYNSEGYKTLGSRFAEKAIELIEKKSK